MKRYDIDSLQVKMPQEGEPKYDIRGINRYCKEHGIDLKKTNGVPPDILKKFKIGYY